MSRPTWVFGFVVLVSVLAWTDSARAGWFSKRNEVACDRPAYPRAHYWTPTVARWRNGLRGSGVGCQHLYPEIPGEVRIMPYACRYADPVTIPYAVGPAPMAIIPVYPYGSIPPGSE